MQSAVKISAAKKETRTSSAAGAPKLLRTSPYSWSRARMISAPSQISQSRPARPRFGGGSGAGSIGKGGRVGGTPLLYAIWPVEFLRRRQKAEGRKQKSWRRTRDDRQATRQKAEGRSPCGER